MDKNKQYFIYLVSCFLNNEAPKYDKSVSLGEIYKIASTHGLCEAVCQAALSYFDKDLTDEKMRSVFSQWIDNEHNDLEDKNTIILKIELTDGILMSHGTRYEIDFTI